MTRRRIQFEFPLHPGDHGPDVAQAQSNLVDSGLFIASTELTEQRFGPATSKAVTRWPRRHGLPISGELGKEDLDRLWAEGRERPRVVQGVVSLADGTPVPNLRVVLHETETIAGRLAGAMSAKGWDRCYSRTMPFSLPKAKLRCSFDRSFNNSLTMFATWIRARGQFNPIGTCGPPFADRSTPNGKS
jgi:peptidoglycan hydrolase-like protein with peptidoglycan-binding domain